MRQAIKQREEILAFIIDEQKEPVFQQIGDLQHIFSTRSPEIPMFVKLTYDTNLRPLTAMLTLGRKIACYLDEQDDVSHAAKRLTYNAPHIAQINVAVFNTGEWSTHMLQDLI